MKRMRGRGHRGGGGGGGGGGGQYRHQSSGGGNVPLNRNHVFDSSGPDLRVRGTAQQLFEKYLQLGRDATGAGDRVMAESYFQHAEHYFRILNAMNQAAQQQGGQHQGGQQQHQPRRSQYGEGGEQAAADGGEAPEEAEVIRPALPEQPNGEARDTDMAAPAER